MYVCVCVCVCVCVISVICLLQGRFLALRCWRSTLNVLIQLCHLGICFMTFGYHDQLVFFFHSYLTWNYGYFKARGIPHPKPKLFVGNFDKINTLVTNHSLSFLVAFRTCVSSMEQFCA